jgi:hypothetical protein
MELLEVKELLLRVITYKFLQDELFQKLVEDTLLAKY